MRGRSPVTSVVWLGSRALLPLSSYPWTAARQQTHRHPDFTETSGTFKDRDVGVADLKLRATAPVEHESEHGAIGEVGTSQGREPIRTHVRL
jgi:hypothetical protein